MNFKVCGNINDNYKKKQKVVLSLKKQFYSKFKIG